MGGTIKAFSLRFIAHNEAALFAGWERAERPYPWPASVFPSTTLVFDGDQGVVGYAVVKVVGEEAYLSNIMVDPARRRQGIGGDMLQKVIMWAESEGAATVILDVDTKNAAAVGLYKKFGFEIIQERKASYPKGEDGYVMRKKI